VLVNIAFRFAFTLFARIWMAVPHTNVWARLAVPVAFYALALLWLVVGIWQLVGVWRSATYYHRFGGWPGWVVIVKLQVIIGWLLYLILAVAIASKFLLKCSKRQGERRG